MRACRDAWNKVEIGTFLTSESFRIMSRLEDTRQARSRTARFLGRKVQAGVAENLGKDGIHTVYKKTNQVELVSSKQQESPRLASLVERQFSMLELGEAVFELIQKLKKDLINLTTKLKEEKDLMKEIVEENTQLKQVLRDAQAKILALNASSQRSFRMSEVQEFRESLPGGQ